MSGAPLLLPAQTKPGTDAWRQARAREIIRDHSLLAGGAHVIPVPFVNSLTVAGVQLKMLAELSSLYGKNFDHQAGRNLVSALGMGAIHHIFTEYSGRGLGLLALAAMPAVGLTLAFVAWPAAFATYTHALGIALVRHYDAGGEFKDFRAQALRDTVFAPLAAHFIVR